MPYKLISLVLLLFFLIINKAYCENEFLLPLKKPSIFKSFKDDLIKNAKNNLPQKKPTISSNQPEEKILEKDSDKKIKQKLTITDKKTIEKVNIFIYPNCNKDKKP